MEDDAELHFWDRVLFNEIMGNFHFPPGIDGANVGRVKSNMELCSSVCKAYGRHISSPQQFHNITFSLIGKHNTSWNHYIRVSRKIDMPSFLFVQSYISLSSRDKAFYYWYVTYCSHSFKANPPLLLGVKGRVNLSGLWVTCSSGDAEFAGSD